MHYRVAAPVFIGACIALAGCGGGGSTPGPQNTPPPDVTFSHAYGPHQVTAINGTPWMITNIATTLSGKMYIGGDDLYDTLRVDVTVAPNVSASTLPAPGTDLTSPNAVAIQVGIDPQGNESAGGFKTCVFGPNSLDFAFNSASGPRLADGNFPLFFGSAPVFSGGPNPPAEAVTSVANSVISQSFYLPTIRVFSGKSVPHIGIAVSIFNGADVASVDCEPSSGIEQFTDS